MIEVVMGDHISRTGRALQRLLEDPGDVVGAVNWTGAPFEETMFTVLNSRSRTDKLAQLVRLDLCRIPVPPYSLTPQAGWLPRRKDHQQGRDFTNPPEKPDFWVLRITNDDEWRIHVFKTKKGNFRILRSGLKLPNRRNFHPWVRSHRLGWKLSYTGGASEAAKDMARESLAALDLDFAAVDIATAFGDPTVLEVNTCPGLDSGTLRLYSEAIQERLGA